MLQKKCPYFYEWDEILGSRYNTSPPVLMEPGRTVIQNETHTSTDESSGPNQNESSKPTTTNESATTTHTNGLKPVGGGKRPFSAVHPYHLHDALMKIHNEKCERREKRFKEESSFKEKQLLLQEQALELQREELRLREKKMDQQFELQRMQLDVERERLKLQVNK
ncbi:hypothetical protein Ae201684P_009097 [Aphanomyces euteiches]|uniref:Uncharacterized protein n=1 Tax=Aphanomyces euteiches TaxID=100861 RepID=A0A6G0WG49_9STRA|nr:hypothetical protein Ae201684_015867 [Aphanomyces euteiches]KAH9080151.1 hypothetical protein Ae201684P_009097 [Aphanomyces euteiches]KAH9144316.1 hypothetical protein AeRB84_011740 [Aphanomyces euteiches]